MKNKYSSVIRNYFSDYVSWLVVVSVLFAIVVALMVSMREIDEFFWAIPALFFIIYLMTTPLLILYCKVSKDIKTGNIEKATIKISEMQYDGRFTFKNNSGATSGKRKYKIVDENHNSYLISTENEKDVFLGFSPRPSFYLEIEFLKKSRLVLKMRIIDNFQTISEACEQKQNIQQFRRVFGHYF
ncbi:MAG: hypothetical protein E7438_04235 [Ruminococcaceae bacterium]|nr:hypothetical protein [Oscillospiraceae bacterium]